MLQRMHGKAGKRPGCYIPVMQHMHPVIQKPDMQESVHPVKMKCYPDKNQRQGQNKPARMIGKPKALNKSIRHGPNHQNLIGRPDQYPTDQRMKHIFKQLIAEQKATAFGH